ncbi:MAG TPA: glycosyltransferase family 2 protein [Actinomycetota bacterium]|nr:glycosyltransferase family 2 protein [Actinomycetota bacterium]
MSVVAPREVPTVLAVLVVRRDDGSLRDCLASLAAQTYPRLAVLAVDDASHDGSDDVLVRALGEGRVLRNEAAMGLARSVDRALATPVAAKADHVLILHDDVALDVDAVARLVEATMIPGVERVGIVGAKVVDWDRPRILRDVGRSADRFGHPFSSLQADELDQGQFDRVLEVLTVDGCAMLVSREVWQGIGLFDERLGDGADLDVCWRARVAGWRVVMTPLARVRHRGPAVGAARRYDEDRIALATIVKNYSWWSLAKVLAVALPLTLVRLLYLTLSRRFEEATDVARAWGWNVAHLPGTLRRRRGVQKTRTVRDRALRRYTESAGLRLPRWFQTAERIFEEQRGFGDDEDGTRTIRDRTTSLLVTHPVIVAATVGLVVGGVVIRDLLGPEPLVGAALPAFPATPSGFFAELLSAYRTTGLGGSLTASPGLALLGGISAATFGSTAIAEKVVLAATPGIGAVLMYRAAVRRTGRPGPSTVAAAAYVLSALVLWAFSEGRIGLLVGLAALPALVERLAVAFDRDEPIDGDRRLAAGIAVTLAVAVAFWPGIALAVLVVVVVELMFGRRRARGLAVAGAALLGAAVLSFPFVPTLIAGRGAAITSTIGTVDTAELGRLALGGGPGTWIAAWFLPAAAVLALTVVGAPFRAPAWRAAILAALGLALAWASAGGWLPAPLTNASAYAGLAVVGEALLVAYGLSSALGGLDREAFGVRQIVTGLLVAVLVAGVVLQSIAAMTGRRATGSLDRVPAAWAVIDNAARGSFRVLWVGGRSGEPFPPPGGDPQSVIEAGDATLRAALTDRTGTTALDVGRPLAGPGAEALWRSVGEILAGGTMHGGALLAPFAVRYVVAREGDLPDAAAERLEAQTDLDRIPASGLVIFRNGAALPPAGAFPGEGVVADAARGGDASTLQRLERVRADVLQRAPGGWDGAAGEPLVALSTEFDPAWEIVGADAEPIEAFGWATAFSPAPTDVRIRHGAQLPHTLSILVLAALWLAALWITRKPVAR